MAGADAAAGVAVEVFVEQHQVAPVRIVGVAAVVAVAGPPARFVGQKEPRQPAAQFVRPLASDSSFAPSRCGHSTCSASP